MEFEICPRNLLEHLAVSGSLGRSVYSRRSVTGFASQLLATREDTTTKAMRLWGRPIKRPIGPDMNLKANDREMDHDKASVSLYIVGSY